MAGARCLDGSDGWVVPRPTNPSKFRRDFASGKSHSASPPLSSFSIHIPCVSKHPRISHPFIRFLYCNVLVANFFIHPFIGWPSPFRFWSFILEIQSKYGISFEALARGAAHPMNSLAPSKALLSGRPLAILGNLNCLLWVFYERRGRRPIGTKKRKW